MPVFVLVAVLILACINAGSSELKLMAAQQDAGFVTPQPYSVADWLAVVWESIRPIETLFVGALAWLSLSAVRAGEQPARFWVVLLGGAVLLFGLDMHNFVGDLIAIDGPVSPDMWANLFIGLAPLAIVADLGGVLLLVVAFAGGLANDPLDLGPVVER